ncbi:MAG: phage holin family protein [Tannerellaceae bacterium]|jgi:hypothetical protein|nr:phage holin family protein [Tannerellaceae bacterium]
MITKFAQLATSALGGLLIAVEASFIFVIPCFLVTVLDIYSAWCLGRRLHKKYPDRCDGKFKSEYKYRILQTMIIAFVLIILAKYIDILVLEDNNLAVRWAAGFFFVYQAWSILENWSSENDAKWARVIQRIVVNKAERHFNVPMKDILIPEDKEDERKR